MTRLDRLPYLRATVEGDDAFLYDVFCTTWESEVAALPNPKLAQHVLRIQHIAQERRFRSRYPDHEQFIVLEGGEPAGRLYVDHTDENLHVVDLTLLPRFQSRGIGTSVFGDLQKIATEDGLTVTLRVPRRNLRATELYTRVGFRLVTLDDLDNYFEWAPAGQRERQHEDAVKEAVKESEHALD